MKLKSVSICYATIFAIASWCCNYAIAQTNQWTWMKGSNLANQPGIYGTMAVPDAANTPGSRTGSVSWKDNAGNLWLFGGSGTASSGSGYLNDLWKLDIATGNWVWIKGSSSPVSQNDAVYGTQGVAAPTNVPGGRYGSLSWIDNANNLWLMGGFGFTATSFGQLNDLWKYDIASGNWTWMKGSNTPNVAGSYGTKGLATATNTPGSRYGGAAWKDNSGNLWLFGGNGFATNTSSSATLNDLWKYDITTGNWTWMNGSNATDQPGNYGSVGIPTSTNTPGGRTLPTSWTDNSGNFWLFGGNGVAATNGIGYLNDLWKYDVASDNWTWMKGSDSKDQLGTYGVIGTAATPYNPGSRFSAASWKDNYGNLWLMGGFGLDNNNSLDNLSDLWRYDINTGYWSWVKGSNVAGQPGVYGTQGTAAANNLPGARYFHVSWTDNGGNLLLFGGYGTDANGTNGTLNDLWKYSPPATILPLSITQFTATRQDKTAQLSWSVAQEQNIASYTIECSANGRNFVSIGSIASLGNTTRSRTYNFTDFKPIQGSNYYRIRIVEKDNQQSYSDIRVLNFGSKSNIIIYPNPVKDEANITGLEAGMYLKLVSTTGQILLAQKVNGTVEQMPAKALATGNYRVQVYSATGKLLVTTTLVKE